MKLNTKSGEVIKSDTYCGTTSYNPPEVLKHIPYDPFKGDIWCLGVMLFIMLNQEYPFDRHDGKDLMYEKQMTRQYQMSEDIDRKCSECVKDLIRVMLEPDAKKRPDIFKVCTHPWFPLILREAELLGLVPIVTALPGSSTNLSGQHRGQ